MIFANSTAILTDAFPATPARHGAGHQPGRRDRRLVHRPRARWRAGRVGLARGVLGQRADRHRRHHLVVPRRCTNSAPAGTAGSTGGATSRSPSACPRCWPAITYGIQPYGGHSTGWTNPWVLAGLIGGVVLLVAFCVDRDEGRRPDVPHRPVQEPTFAVRQPGRPARLDRPRRHAVHADHLAAGHLAAAARLQLRRHAAVGRHLPAAADRRLPGRRAGVRATCPTGSGTRSFAGRRPGHRRGHVRRAAAAAGRLPVLAVRPADRDQRHRLRPVLARRTPRR